MTSPIHAATLPHGAAMLDKDLGEVGLIAGIGAAVTWFVQRLAKSPDESRDELARLRERVIRLEAKLGSGSDIGSVMHTLGEMREESRDRFDRMEKAITDLTNNRRMS
jgi:hypothetical protein